jgi:hypothetical protein
VAETCCAGILDDEKELGINPTIVLSIGETRRFDLKHKDNLNYNIKFELLVHQLL